MKFAVGQRWLNKPGGYQFIIEVMKVSSDSLTVLEWMCVQHITSNIGWYLGGIYQSKLFFDVMQLLPNQEKLVS